MRQRLKSWARTVTKLVLLVLGYFWLGAGYKLAYGQMHDTSRFTNRARLPYYQHQFLVESLIHQTWMFGPDFREYIGELPSLGALASSNPIATLADYFKTRERQLSALPERYPYSLFNAEALNDAYGCSQIGAFLGILGTRDQPARVLAQPTAGGRWQFTGSASLDQALLLARRLADQYPNNAQAPRALFSAANLQTQNSDSSGARVLLQRIVDEYPRSEQAPQAADALYRMARDAGDLDDARRYKRLALQAAETSARERYTGRALPAEETVSIMGFRVSLASLDLGLRQIEEAREQLDIAGEEEQRVRSITSLPEDIRGSLRENRRDMEQRRSELWVADLFKKLNVGVPGPPPRPREYAVTGRITYGGDGLEDVVVLLPEWRGRVRGMDWMGANLLSSTRYRATTDRHGDYRIPGVLAGDYRPAVLYPVKPAIAGGASVVPTDALPDRVTVNGARHALPEIRFGRAVGGRTFGEVGVDGKNVRVEWEPFPRAASYRIQVLAARGIVGPWQYQQRVPPPRRFRFLRNPVLWQKDRVATSSVDCPLLSLAPDIPAAARIAEYEYRISALDAQGNEIASSVPPLGRFHLSTPAFTELMKLNPPTRTRQGPGGRFRGRGLRRGPGV